MRAIRPSLLVVTSLALGASPALADLRQDVDAVLEANRRAETLAEWQSSGRTPHEVFESAAGSGRLTELCEALRGLEGPDLALFDPELHPEVSLPCADVIGGRLEAYWWSERLGFGESSLFESGDPLEDAAPLGFREERIDATRGPELFSGDLGAREIALTFDDGPHPRRTRAVVRTLDRFGVRANFFLVGGRTRANERHRRTAFATAAAGHSVGSHSWSHPNLRKLSRESAESQILRGHQAVESTTGVIMPFFRFPYGARNPYLRRFVSDSGMASFMWNLDSLDWKIRSTRELYDRVIRLINRTDNGILLFHDIHQQTVDVLPLLLRELQRRNYTIVQFVPH